METCTVPYSRLVEGAKKEGPVERRTLWWLQLPVACVHFVDVNNMVMFPCFCNVETMGVLHAGAYVWMVDSIHL